MSKPGYLKGRLQEQEAGEKCLCRVEEAVAAAADVAADVAVLGEEGGVEEKGVMDRLIDHMTDFDPDPGLD